ncbi:MAG: hypothetical protein GF381_04145 [Candidatus Pacebacteria bacterium]|nr:hypothetical protein [Candidatus Paceibacterota bacterium]
MKIFYSGSISRSKKLIPISRDIVNHIESLNHEVITKKLVDPDYAQQLDLNKKYNGKEVYQWAEDKLKEAEILVTECTVPSFGAAFWIDKCLEMGKALLSLHYGLDYKNAPLMLQGCRERINLQMYTEENYKYVLEQFFEELT